MSDEPLSIHTDHQFPAITAQIVDVVFAALRPGLPLDVEAPDASDPVAGWRAIGRLAGTMPFSTLSDALARLEQAQGPTAADALYAFTWGIYHSRADGVFDED